MPRSFMERHAMQPRFCLRVTVAALSALTLGRLLGVPMVLWAVLTAVILTQMSIGKSVKATIDYSLGTLGGAVYAGLIAVFIPHQSDAAFAAVLAIAISAARSARRNEPQIRRGSDHRRDRRSGPNSHTWHVSRLRRRSRPRGDAGGSVALAVSLLVFPTCARKLVKDSAADMLDLIANILPDLFLGFTQKSDADAISARQRGVGAAFSKLELIRAEAKHEEMTFLASEPDFDPLRHALLRLRHDLVMIGRAATAPLPQALQGRVGPLLARASPSRRRASAQVRDGAEDRRRPSRSRGIGRGASMHSRPKSRRFAGRACYENFRSKRWNMFSR